ncbi:hypothetical protein OV203_16830 [Nannocystis sp. ILAH1]|uniref:hypothetical protein n=1 Tax=unclassified Nannocystis TaxID=2627009 RepID=UPI00226DD144|nr:MULTISPECIES: hypothetical protein [unclassified Nannocystis]MCY0988803.1 hypothetical protein [Nannocystis sp. ILAH1]MCY1072770.1 hypothetical protein [Nannocystis sp. RBIL2]
MPRHVALAAALVTATVLAAPGCKKAPQRVPSTATGAPPRARTPEGPALPAPHQLSQMPDAGAFIARPAEVLAGVDAYLPEVPALPTFAEFVLRMQAPAELADKLSPQVVGDRPWAGVHVAGEDIVVLPVRPGSAVADALKGLESVGDFGAVQLPAPAGDSTPADGQPPAPRLAWLDGQTNNLVFAATLQGLATSRQLPATYGSRPLWFTLADTRARAVMPEFPYARVAAAGQGLHSLDVHVLEAPGKPLPTSPDLANGALTGMLEVPELAAGVSTRWPGHKKAVADAIKQMNAGVDRAGFAAKLMLDPLVAQAAKALRRWNGRVLLGTGPARHLRLGLGADDPAAGYRDLVGCLRTLVDNLSLARMFADVPGASFKKVGDNPTVYLLTVDGVSRHVPAVGKPLLDDKGRLRVALAADERAGGLLVVIGPEPLPVIQRWAKAAGEGEPAKSSADDLLSAVLAVSPERLKPLLQTTSQSLLVTGALGLDADRDPTLMVLQRKPDRYFATVRGPELEVDRRKRN